MNKMRTLLLAALAVGLVACASQEKTSYFPQKILQTVNDKYPNTYHHLLYVPAPDGFVAPRESRIEVEDKVDSGKVVALISALNVKTGTVVVTGNDDDITEATVTRALTDGMPKISGAKMIYVGGKDSLPRISKLAQSAGVEIEFMDVPS